MATNQSLNISALKDKVLATLRVKTRVGGLEISDSVLRFAYLENGEWKFSSLRLPPGLIENGRVKNHSEFVEALRVLRGEVMGPSQKNKKINTVASLSSINIYTQVFSLPMIEGENLEKAIQLNIQMVSPAESSQTYSGWQLVGEDQKSVRLEILSSFIERAVVDDINHALREAGFIVYSIESRALSLTRLARELGAGFDRTKSYILLSLDNNGLEFLVIRQAQLYFQYFNSWSDLQGEEREISAATFEAAVTRNLQQVLNFYNSHWSEPVSEILIAASALRDQLVKIVTENFSFKTSDLILSTPQSITPEWYVALGSGFRSLTPRRADQDISLLGISAREDFRRHQIVNFLDFWRVLVPVALTVLLLAFFGADIFVTQSRRSLEARVQANSGQAESEEMEKLRVEANQFNRSVALIEHIQGANQVKVGILEKVQSLFQEQGIILKNVSIAGIGSPVIAKGEAKTEDEIIRLKKAFDANGEFVNVNLPLTEIRPVTQGVSFSMTFSISPKTP